MFQGFTGWHALIILVVILLLFGAPKLPALARSLGESMKILKREVRSDQADGTDGTTTATAADSASTGAPQSTVSATESKPAAGTADSGRPSS